MAKPQSLDLKLKKIFASIYKLSTSIAEVPTQIYIKNDSINLVYSNEQGISTMYVTRVDAKPWFEDVPDFYVSIGDLKLLKTPKNIKSFIYDETENKIKIQLITTDETLSLNCELNDTENSKSIDLINSLKWSSVNIKDRFAVSTDFARVNLSTGKVYNPGEEEIGPNSNILLIGKKLVPKVFLNDETLFALSLKNENYGTPYGLFRNKNFNALVKYSEILISV